MTYPTFDSAAACDVSLGPHVPDTNIIRPGSYKHDRAMMMFLEIGGVRFQCADPDWFRHLINQANAALISAGYPAHITASNDDAQADGADPDQGSRWRGHAIDKDESGAWRYTNNGVLVSDFPDRDCGHCGKENTPEGHDACLGTLPNVMNACCGHGMMADAYVQFPNGETVRGKDAIAYMHMLGAKKPEQAA